MAAETATMTGREALEELGSLENLHSALAKRATGITWLVWGIAIGGLFVTYNFLGVLTALEDDVIHPAAFSVAWAPWVAMGLVTTILLWRSVGLVVPSNVSRRELVIGVILFLVLIPGGIFLVEAMGAPWVEPAIALAVTGGVYVLMGAMGWTCTDRVERWAWFVVGGLYVGASVVGSLAVGGNEDAAYALFSFLAPGLILTAQTATGLYLALRA